jgi:hypothetical protein
MGDRCSRNRGNRSRDEKAFHVLLLEWRRLPPGQSALVSKKGQS